jgi:gliding motility-associated-like protein
VIDKNNIEFDEIFRHQLENTSAPVPPGVWEGISSSIGAGTGVAAAAVKTAIWMKVAIATTVIGVASLVAYQVFVRKDAEVINKPVIIDNTSEISVNSTNQEGNKDHTVVANSQAGHVQVPETMAATHAVRKEIFRKPAIASPNKAEVPYIHESSFYEIKDEVSMNYVSNMNESVVPKIDTARNNSQAGEEKTEIPYIPEKEPVAYLVDSSFLYVPNVVTPNGDGVNDEYLIDIKGEEFVVITIYSLKSVKLFETRNKTVAWDCKMPNGEPAPEGNYIVKVVYKFKNKAKSTSSTMLRLIK